MLRPIESGRVSKRAAADEARHFVDQHLQKGLSYNQLAELLLASEACPQAVSWMHYSQRPRWGAALKKLLDTITRDVNGVPVPIYHSIRGVVVVDGNEVQLELPVNIMTCPTRQAATVCKNYDSRARDNLRMGKAIRQLRAELFPHEQLRFDFFDERKPGVKT